MLTAARTLFVSNGYAATTVADIAAEAGVALQTVYSAVGPKASLLLALLDQAREDARVHGIDASAEAHAGPMAVVESGPRVRRAMMEHGGDIIRLLAENAATEPDVRRAWEELLRRAQGGAEIAMRLLDDYGALRPGLEPSSAADQAGAIMHLSSVMFLMDRGWSLERIEAWMLDALIRTLTTLDPPDAASGEAPGGAASGEAADTALDQ